MNGYIFACILHRTLVARGGGMDVGIRISVLTAALYRYQREHVEQKSVDLRLGHERESGPGYGLRILHCRIGLLPAVIFRTINRPDVVNISPDAVKNFREPVLRNQHCRIQDGISSVHL